MRLSRLRAVTQGAILVLAMVGTESELAPPHLAKLSGGGGKAEYKPTAPPSFSTAFPA